ncbi:hypothetical protein [Nonomuraea glycinis]|uniref:hypothetical protein n=1 Tax=Nonomuraea glycinis TaxID=2047744 RepID=UPI002E104EC9|nr:hypothetical protein OHA68_13110 [Nonomuraea glycinis]
MNHDRRTAFINGLLELAAFLTENPDLPIGQSLALYHFPRHDTDADLYAEIDEIAARLGTPIDHEDSPHGHYATSRFFGPVEYRAVAIPARARALHDAETSYHGCIDPDPTPAT